MALVSDKFVDYFNSFLYSLDFNRYVEIPSLILSDAAAAAAFRLAECWGTTAAGNDATMPVSATGIPAQTAKLGISAGDSAEEDEEMKEDEQAAGVGFDWDEPTEVLPPDLSALVTRVSKGERLDVKTLLSALPRWEGLKTRAEDNNHRQDGRRQAERWLKDVQQKLLNAARIIAAVHTGIEDAEVLSCSQQLFMYILTIEAEIVAERKRRSIPTSTASTSNVLFGTEELRNTKQQQNVNAAWRRQVW